MISLDFFGCCFLLLWRWVSTKFHGMWIFIQNRRAKTAHRKLHSDTPCQIHPFSERPNGAFLKIGSVAAWACNGLSGPSLHVWHSETGRNSVSESTAHQVARRELSEFLASYCWCAKASSSSFSQNSLILAQNSVSQPLLQRFPKGTWNDNSHEATPNLMQSRWRLLSFFLVMSRSLHFAVVARFCKSRHFTAVGMQLL